MIPNLDNTTNLVLHEGMIFDTQEEVMGAYNQYTYHKGFDIRKGWSYQSSKGKKIIR